MAKKLLLNGSDEVVSKYAIKDSHGTDLDQASLQEQINNLVSLDRYMSDWNAQTGLAMSNPPQSPYTYPVGAYFIISVVDLLSQYNAYDSSLTYNTGDKVTYNSATYLCNEDGVTGDWDGTKWTAHTPKNYKPFGSTYTIGVASETVETDTIAVGDRYYFDGTNWVLLKSQVDYSAFAQKAGNNTFTGTNTFSNGIKADEIKDTSNNTMLDFSNGDVDLGNNDIKTTGNISDGTNSTTVADICKNANIAPTYSSSSTYTVGDFVIYNGQLYKCNTTISTAEEWTAEHWTSAKVSDSFVDLTSRQTISGVKTFAQPINLTSNGYAKITSNNTKVVINAFNNAALNIERTGIYPSNYPSQEDLGKSSAKWQDLYLAGSIKDGTNSVSVADICKNANIAPTYSSSSTYTVGDFVIYNGQLYKCNTTISTAEEWTAEHWTSVNIGGEVENGTFNVINASDIAADGTLTDAQFTLFTNGKPTLIKGTILYLVNALFFPPNISSGIYKGLVIGSRTYTDYNTIITYTVNSTTKVISVSLNKGILFGNNQFWLKNVDMINEKVIPAYPSNNIDADLVYRNNAIAWLESGTITDTTSTSFSGAIGSNKEYQFTQPLTSLTISSFEITSGDNNPVWSIAFIVGTGFTLTLPTGVNWAYGTPTWENGIEYTIVIKKSVTSGNYVAYQIRG